MTERPRWLGMHEPATTLTDYALALVTGVLAVHLWRRGWPAHPAVALWGCAFALTAGAAAAGGTVHGFAARLGPRAARRLWKLTLALVGGIGFCLVASAALSGASPAYRAGLLALAAAKLAAYLAWIVAREDFRFALYDAAASLAVVLGAQAHAALARGEPGARWIVAGVLLSFAAAGIQRSGLRLHRHLNHNDLFHVLQAGAAYLLYRGGLLL